MGPIDKGQIIFIGSQKPLQIFENDLYLYSHEALIPKDTELNTDDKPVLEFSVAGNIYGDKIKNTDEPDLRVKRP